MIRGLRFAGVAMPACDSPEESRCSIAVTANLQANMGLYRDGTALHVNHTGFRGNYP